MALLMPFYGPSLHTETCKQLALQPTPFTNSVTAPYGDLSVGRHPLNLSIPISVVSPDHLLSSRQRPPSKTGRVQMSSALWRSWEVCVWGGGGGAPTLRMNKTLKEVGRRAVIPHTLIFLSSRQAASSKTCRVQMSSALWRSAFWGGGGGMWTPV